ncbi:MAG: MurR/RpiR family transcriptional regulator [Atopobiaceae bacterium]|nr:MurR/RpiR family transcriptional regulator [Atopobiaceae bacterium]
MIYNKLPVALLSLLATEDADSTNAQIASFLMEHAHEAGDLSIKGLAAACHVGTGTVSRFARDAGFESFAELREAFAEAGEGFDRVPGNSMHDRTELLVRAVGGSVTRAAATVDRAALGRLVADLHAFAKVGVYGLLKAQAAALDLQVDLLSLGKLADTCVSVADQARRIRESSSDKLIIVFTYTGTYFDAVEVGDALRRPDRPKVWMVSGDVRKPPSFVSDRVTFASDQDRLGHPYSLEFVAGLIAQEYAATR